MRNPLSGSLNAFWKCFFSSAAALTLTACGPKFFNEGYLNSLTDTQGSPSAPTLSFLQISDISPTSNQPLTLAYGSIDGSYTEYCVLENNPNATSCVWTAGSVPATFAAAETDGNVTLSVWLKDANGAISSRVDSNVVYVDRVAPQIASFSITNSNPTNTTTYGLSYGAITGTYTHYCIRENDTAVAGCVWTAGAPPGNFTVASTENAKTLSLWLRDAAGNVSVRRDTAAVTLDTTAPILASVTVDNGTPTDTNPFSLSYGTVTGTYSQYCILQNDTTLANCSFVAGTLPASYTVTGGNGNKTLSFWLRDAAGNTSARVDSSTINYTGVLAISPTSTTATATYGRSTIYGGRLDMGSIALSSGDLFVAGGLANTTAIAEAFYVRDTTHKWEGVAPMHTARARPRLIELSSGKILAIGGCTNTTDTGSDKLEIFDPATGKWAQLASMSKSRCRHTATLMNNGKVLVVGGRTGATYHGDTEIYDPAANAWSAGPALAANRSDHEAVKDSSGKVWWFGGWDGTTHHATTSYYDPSAGTITAGPNLNTARREFGLIGVAPADDPTGQDAFLVLGGFDGTTYLSSVEKVQVSTGTSVNKTSMTIARRGNNSYTAMPGGNVLAVGGWTNAGGLNNGVAYYNNSADTWTAKTGAWVNVTRNVVGRLGDGRIVSIGGSDSNFLNGSPRIFEFNYTGNSWANGYDLIRNMVNVASVLLDDGRVLSCGGYDQGSDAQQDECWVYHPSKHASKSVGRLRLAVDGVRAIKMTNGKVALLGGYVNGGFSRNLDIFDPATDTLTAGTNMPRYLGNTIAVALPGAKVLVAGGEGGVAWNSTGASNLSWIYDDGAGTWTATGNLPAAIYRTAFTVTPSGRVFAVGGYNGTTWSNQIIEYDVGGGTWSTKAGAMNETSGREWPSLVSYASGGNEYLVVAGGSRDLFSVNLTTVERYDVTNDTWTSLNSMPNAKTIHAAQVNVAANKMWVFGGWGGAYNGVYEMNLTAGTWTTVTNLGANRYNTFTSSVPLPDGRMYLIHGDVNQPGEVYHYAAPKTYTASGGDKNYTFSLVGGGQGIMHDQARVYIPPFPLPGGTSTVRVTDGLGATADSTVTH